MVKPNQVIKFNFPVQTPSTGAAVNADSTPTCVVYLNNAVDASVTVTVTNPATGSYNGSFTVPSGYVAGDDVQARATATVGGVTSPPVVVWQDTVDTKRVSDVPTAAQNASAVRTELGTELGRIDTNVTSRSSHSAANVRTEMDANSTKLANLDATISSRASQTSVDALPTAASIKTALEAAGSSLDTLLSRLSSSRAGYLDKLNITGNVASSAEVTAIQNNTSTRFVVPDFFERPDSGSSAFVIDLYIYDENGNMEATDSTPTVAVLNESGTDRSANLSAISTIGTGHYRATYTVANNAPIEQLRFEATIVEGGATRLAGASAFVVDTSAVDFTAADRQTLADIVGYVDELESRLTSARALLLDKLNVSGTLANTANADTFKADVSNLATTTQISALNNLSAAQVRTQVDNGLAAYDAPTNAEMEARTLVAADYATDAKQTTILNRIGAFTGTGINTVLGFLKAALSKTASTPSDIGGTFNPATDSVEAIRDRGDVAWLSGTGGGGLSGSNSVVLTWNDASDNPVPLVEFTIEGIASKRAGVDGTYSFGLNDGTYNVISNTTSGVMFEPFELVVNGASVAATITGSAVQYPTASSPDKRSVRVDLDAFSDVVGETVSGVAITVKLSLTKNGGAYVGSARLNGKIFRQGTVAVGTTNTNGIKDVSLVPTADFVLDSGVIAHYEAYADGVLLRKFTLAHGDMSGVSLEELSEAVGV